MANNNIPIIDLDDDVLTHQPTADDLNMGFNQDMDWTNKRLELNKLENDIQTLHDAISRKEKEARELRTQLGIAGPLDKIKDAAEELESKVSVLADGIQSDLNISLSQNQTVQNTQRVLADVTGNAVDVLGTAAGAVGSKFAELKESETMNKLTAGASSLLSSVSSTATNIMKPQPREFNDGTNS